MTLDIRDARVGMAVVYVPPQGSPREDGVVTFVSPTFVFVRFTDQHPDAPGKACWPRSLERA